MAQTFLPTTPFNLDSNANFIVGPGVLVTGFEWDTDKGAYTYDRTLGATTGGTQVALVTTLRSPEIDGLLTAPVGLDQIEETEGTMTLNLMEATKENLSMALIADELIADEGQLGLKPGQEYVRPTSRIQEKHYIKNFALLVPKSDDSVLVIRFDYAISEEGLETEPQQGEDNTMSVVMSARTNPENLLHAGLPVTVFEVERAQGTP